MGLAAVVARGLDPLHRDRLWLWLRLSSLHACLSLPFIVSDLSPHPPLSAFLLKLVEPTVFLCRALTTPCVAEPFCTNILVRSESWGLGRGGVALILGRGATTRI